MAFKNLLWVGAGTEMRTQYQPAHCTYGVCNFTLACLISLFLNLVCSGWIPLNWDGKLAENEYETI